MKQLLFYSFMLVIDSPLQLYILAIKLELFKDMRILHHFFFQ